MIEDAERLRRWRLMLGAASGSAGSGAEIPGEGTGLSPEDVRIDAALAALYDTPDPDAGPRGSGLGGSAPRVARWLGDIRSYFGQRVVQVMQRDAVDRLGITRLLLEPELLDAVEPDVHLVGTLLTLRGAIPDHTMATARAVVARVVAEVEARIAVGTRAAVTGALNRAARTRRPKLPDINWSATIRENLAHYLPDQRTIVPERLIGYGRRHHAIHKHIVLALDQSGSMAASVVYASVFAAVLASIRSLKTSVVAFDTAVVDLTDSLSDPVEMLFGVQLGGGTDINRAIAYCQDLIEAPRETIFILISDLYEGGVRDDMLRRLNQLTQAGTQVIVLLALSDEGAPAYDHDLAADLVDLGIPAFACTPDAFPDLLATTLAGGSPAGWAEREQATRR